MAEDNVPAWKRLGLKQTKQTPKSSQAAYDPLKEGLKRAHESGETAKPTKPAKKVKVPKAERPAATHELDQLAYLRQYHEDRENWKFSKQKQNWILKHLFTEITDERYDQALLAYIEGLMGSARNWVAEDARKIVEEWNNFMRKDLEQKEEGEKPNEAIEADEANKSEKVDAEKPEESEKDSKSTNGKKKQKKAKAVPANNQAPKPKVPSDRMAKRAREIVKILTDEQLHLEFLDEAT